MLLKPSCKFNSEFETNSTKTSLVSTQLRKHCNMAYDNVQTTNAFKILSVMGDKFYLSEELADFHFIFKSVDGQCERIPVHKFVLSIVSDVFLSMFNGTWKEKYEAEIVDIPVAAFKEFLQFFYLDRVNLTMENVDKMLYLGDKYDVIACSNGCEKFLTRELTTDNVCWIYGLAIPFAEKLKKYCEAFIAINTKAVFSSIKFMECSPNVLSHIMKLDSLSCSEADIFVICMAWVKNASKAENLTRTIVEVHLEKAFFDIRYRSMTISDFAALISLFGPLFTNEEFQEIIQLLGNTEFPSVLFNPNPRKDFDAIRPKKSLPTFCPKFVTSMLYTPYYIKDIAKTTFSCNEPVVLESLGLNATFIYQNNRYHWLDNEIQPSEMTIVQMPGQMRTDEEIVLHNQTINFKSMRYIKLILPKSILIMPNCMYEIRFKQNPPNNWCTTALMKSKIEIEPDVFIQFHDDPKEEIESSARGLVYALGINPV